MNPDQPSKIDIWVGQFKPADHHKVARMLKSLKYTIAKSYGTTTSSAPATAVAVTTRTVNSCRNPGCHRDPDSHGFYCAHCEWRLWERLQLEVKKVHKAARRELVGRTGAVEKRHLIHLADSNLPFFTILHWARGRAEAGYESADIFIGVQNVFGSIDPPGPCVVVQLKRDGRELTLPIGRVEGNQHALFHENMSAFLERDVQVLPSDKLLQMVTQSGQYQRLPEIISTMIAKGWPVKIRKPGVPN